jgi:predicted metalloprotease with PDZ domain
LAWYGLQLDRGTESGVANGAREPALAGVGVKWGNSGSQLLVEQVIQGYAGARAGILPGDELLAIDGIRVTAEDFLSFFQKLKPDELVDFTLVRHNRLITLPVRLQNEIPGSYVIRPESKINNREKARMESWLGRDLKFIQ